jgi:Cu2+-exporting ATPase
VPAVQIVATGRLFQQGLFVKSGDALERLAEVDTVIFDKTGTLTHGDLALDAREESVRAVLGRAAMLARTSHHPLARALCAAAGTGPVAPDAHETTGAGVEAVVDGMACRLGSAAWCGVEAPVDAPERLWFRAGDDTVTGFRFQETLRPEVQRLVCSLKLRGLAVEMLTGDREPPARAMAQAAGIPIWRSGVTPAQKAAYVEKLGKRGRQVLMVGDGINDAAAMALAHVSIAPGTATDVSQLASDMVLRGSSLKPIALALDLAHRARGLVLQNFALAVLYNLTAIPLAALGLVTPLIAAATMAGSSLLVTLNALRLSRGDVS